MEHVYVISAAYSYREDKGSWIECAVFDEDRANEILKELQTASDRVYDGIDFSLTKTEIRE